MCGIGGIIKVTPAGEAAKAALAAPPREAIPEHWLDVLDESIRHRGPDGQGRFRDRVVRADGSVVDVALVHRRLSIIDHGGGAQPMMSVLGTSPLRGEPILGTSPLRGEPILGTSPLRGESVFSPARSAITPLLFHGKPNAPVVYEEMRGTGISPVGSQENGHDAHATGGADLLAVVFNGCIYNHRDLRKELQSAGHEFRTDHSDTEVLLHGWREWGEGLFEKLDGMFALAIWDRLAASLVLARDACGEKPLFESLEVGNVHTLVFASLASSISRVKSRIDVSSSAADVTPSVLDEWLRFGWWQSPPTASIHEVQPSEYRILEQRERAEIIAVTTPNAWPPRGSGAPLNAAEADRLLREAVCSRVECDVPLGCFLSGGVDSSLMAVYAAEVLGTLSTFSVQMPDPRYDESSWAQHVAGLLRSRHEALPCEAEPAADLVALIHQMGVPFGDSSLLPSTWVSRAARRHVTVAIGGDGADELFGGYERYVANRWLQRHRRLFAALPTGLLPRRSPRDRVDKLARLIEAARSDGYPELLAIFDSPTMRALVGADRSSRKWARENDPLLWDLVSYLPEDLLRKSDTASMSVALELRSPFLARNVVTRCIATPLDSLMPRGQRKGLLRQVARKYFPADIVDRPKQGFAIPIGEWFRSDYGGMKQLLMDHLNSTEPWGPPRLGIELNMPFVRQMVDEHMSERRDHSQRLYMLLVLSIWAKWLGSLGG